MNQWTELMDFLRPYTAQMLSILRIMSGLLLLQHGTDQVSQLPRRPDEQRPAL